MLERFDRIVLWLDDDHVGQEGAKKFANKLGKERCLIVQTRNGQKDGPKDANDALKAGLSLKAILATAAPIPHQQIMHFREIRAEVKRELVNADQGSSWKNQSIQFHH
jgi:twinkle protein